MALSVAEAVGDAVQAALVTLALEIPGVLPATLVPIARRKLPSLPESKPVPELVISVGAEPATQQLTSRSKLRKYPVAITIVTGEGNKAQDDLIVRKWRDQIDAAVDAKAAFVGVTGFNRVDGGGGPPFDASALSKDFVYSIQTFTVEVIEAQA